MFEAFRAEIGTRILGTEQFLKAVEHHERTDSRVAATGKGLIFVELYGVYEYAVSSSVQGILAALSEARLAPSALHLQALTLMLHPTFESAGNVGPHKVWQRRLDLVNSIESESVLDGLEDRPFPADGSHYRVSQLQTIWQIFGLRTPVLPEPRMIGRVEELVENRNAIAHGRRPAQEIGRAYSLGDIEKRIDDVQKIAHHVLTELEQHYLRGGLLRSSDRTGDEHSV